MTEKQQPFHATHRLQYDSETKEYTPVEIGCEEVTTDGWAK